MATLQAEIDKQVRHSVLFGMKWRVLRLVCVNMYTRFMTVGPGQQPFKRVPLFLVNQLVVSLPSCYLFKSLVTRQVRL